MCHTLSFLSCSFSLHEDWATFFPPSEGYEAGQAFEGIDSTSRNTIPESSNYYISNCDFTESTECSIYFYQTQASKSSILLVEKCFFDAISNNNHGGAIHFYDYGQCVLSSVCGSKCHTSDYRSGQFCYVYASQDPKCKNHIIESSFILSQQANARNTFYHYQGDIKCHGVNASDNEVSLDCGLYIGKPANSSMTFSSFRNNTAIEGLTTGYACIHCYSGYEQFIHQISYTNIIENKQDSDEYGIIYTEGSANLTMKHCSVYGNCNNGKGTVFYVSSGSITCIDCSVDGNQKTSTSGTFTFKEDPSEPFLNYYKFLNLDECNAGLDSWGTLYPILPTPEPTLQPTRTLFESTYDSFKSHINFYRFMEYLILLSCLNPNPSKDIWYDIQ